LLVRCQPIEQLCVDVGLCFCRAKPAAVIDDETRQPANCNEEGDESAQYESEAHHVAEHSNGTRARIFLPTVVWLTQVEGRMMSDVRMLSDERSERRVRRKIILIHQKSGV